MAHEYVAVQWNRHKVIYDLVLGVGVALFLGVFMMIGMRPNAAGHVAHPAILAIRGLGYAGLFMLTLVLAIGPLARLSPRALPFLYNRRHFGVMTFLVAAAHFGLALVWYHSSGPLNPIVSLLVLNPRYQSVPGFPFEVFGLAAFAVLLVLAATSHDYWLNNLSAPLWKAIHMLVYFAYGAIILHVALGLLQTESSLGYAVATGASFVTVVALHLAAGVREWARDDGMKAGGDRRAEWIEICAPDDIPDKRAVIAPLPSGERVAVFRDGAKIFAVTNVCRHQNGPLGEGCVIDGQVTCPWHGWQYDGATGVSPPPYTEKIATYDTRLEGGRVFVRRRANAPGAASQTIRLSEPAP